jgi:hypothetical protein
MNDQHTVTPDEARRLLDQADSISRAAHDRTRWPYVTFILGLGLVTSMGTLAMGLTEGNAFGLTYTATLAAFFALLLFFTVSIRGHSAFARSRRWVTYIVSWFVTYAAAIAVVAWVHGSVLWSVVTSGLVLAVTLACASYEARR